LRPANLLSCEAASGWPLPRELDHGCVARYFSSADDAEPFRSWFKTTSSPSRSNRKLIGRQGPLFCTAFNALSWLQGITPLVLSRSRACDAEHVHLVQPPIQGNSSELPYDGALRRRTVSRHNTWHPLAWPWQLSERERSFGEMRKFAASRSGAS